MNPALLLILSAVDISHRHRVLRTTFPFDQLAELRVPSPIALCAAAYFPRNYKFGVPMAALLISNIVLELPLRVLTR